jgi:serine/threonine protein kinase
MRTEMVGQRLGPYEVVALLESGAMGDVYPARDTALGRDVAIKIGHQTAGSAFTGAPRLS